MSFFEILNYSLWERTLLTTFICPICNREIRNGFIHDGLDHSMSFDDMGVDLFVDKYKTDLISFRESYFYVIFFEKENFYKTSFKEQFDYDSLKDFEIDTIKEFVYKVKRNLIFL